MDWVEEIYTVVKWMLGGIGSLVYLYIAAYIAALAWYGGRREINNQ